MITSLWEYVGVCVCVCVCVWCVCDFLNYMHTRYELKVENYMPTYIHSTTCTTYIILHAIYTHAITVKTHTIWNLYKPIIWYICIHI